MKNFGISLMFLLVVILVVPVPVFSSTDASYDVQEKKEKSKEEEKSPPPKKSTSSRTAVPAKKTPSPTGKAPAGDKAAKTAVPAKKPTADRTSDSDKKSVPVDKTVSSNKASCLLYTSPSPRD